MMQSPRFVIPLAVGVGVVLCTLGIHAVAVGTIVNLVRRERRLGRIGKGIWVDLPLVALVSLLSLLAHLIGIGLWAEVFILCGEFQEFGLAYYHSAVNYTTLGYGDIIYDAVVEAAGAPGSSRWSVDVRYLYGNDFCCHPSVGSSQVCGSEKAIVGSLT
jgi:hypothetical protein